MDIEIAVEGKIDFENSQLIDTCIYAFLNYLELHSL